MDWPHHFKGLDLSHLYMSDPMTILRMEKVFNLKEDFMTSVFGFNVN